MESKRKTRVDINTPSEVHELTFSCLHMMPLLKPDHAKRVFLEELNRARQRLGFEVWAFVIMDNHVHLLVFPKKRKYSMAAIRKSIKQPVSQRLVAELRKSSPQGLERLVSRKRKGKVVYSIWQPGGGYDRNMSSNHVIEASIDYIHMNPVRKGMVASPLDYDWSSARQYHGTGLIKFVVTFPH
jgi:putative transposase